MVYFNFSGNLLSDFHISNRVGIHRTCLEAGSFQACLLLCLKSDPLLFFFFSPLPYKKKCLIAWLLQSGNQHLDLNFRGINYSAELYLNGHQKVLPKGMFRRHSLDVTDILHPDGQNLLAVLVHPPDHPGRIPSEGGQGGDHEVCS
jgi:hypothetical protein